MERAEGSASAATFHGGEGAPVVSGEVRGVLQHGEMTRCEEGRSIEDGELREGELTEGGVQWWWRL
jgi:hypothetical protein